MGYYLGRWALKHDLDKTVLFKTLKVCNCILQSLAGLWRGFSELLSALDLQACPVPCVAWEGSERRQRSGQRRCNNLGALRDPLQMVVQNYIFSFLGELSCNLCSKDTKALARCARRAVHACKVFAGCKHHCQLGSTSDHAAGPLIGSSPELDHLAVLPCLQILPPTPASSLYTVFFLQLTARAGAAFVLNMHYSNNAVFSVEKASAFAQQALGMSIHCGPLHYISFHFMNRGLRSHILVHWQLTSVKAADNCQYLCTG